MEISLDQLLLSAINNPQDETVYSELNKLFEEPDSIFELINIAESQQSPPKMQILSFILIRQIISINFSTFSESNYNFLLQISEKIEAKLTKFFYSQSKIEGLVSQFSALCVFLIHRLNIFYAIGTTEFSLTNLQQPSFYSNITEILIEIIETDSIKSNSFLIANEFLMLSNQEQIIQNEFCKHVYPFVFVNDFSKESIKILNLMNDFSLIPSIFENIEQLNDKETIIEFIKLLNSFYLKQSIFENEEEENSIRVELFNTVFDFSLKCLSENDEDDTNSLSLEAAIFFFNLLNSFSKNLYELIESHLNDLFLHLFEKVGIEKNVELFGISRISLKTIQIISFKFPLQLIPSFISKFESDISSSSNSTIFSSLRTLSKILSIKNIGIINHFSLVDIFKLAIESSMHFIQIPEFAADSAILFSKSLKFICCIQNIQNHQETKKFQEYNEFDINSIGNSGFKLLLQAYSNDDIETKKKLIKAALTLYKFIRISLQEFLADAIQIFVESKSVHEYTLNSYFLGLFIEKSFNKADLQSEFQELIQFVMNSMTTESNLFLLSSLHIISSSISKCPELSPFIVSSMLQKIVEIINSFESSECSAFFLFEKKLNIENISIYSWVIQLLIELNKAEFSLDKETNQLFEPILVQIPSFLNPSLPKSVNQPAWMFLSNFVDLTIKFLHQDQIEEEQKEQQAKILNELAQIVKNTVLSMFEFNLNNNEFEEENFSSLSISIFGIIGKILFTILKEMMNSSDEKDFSFFDQPEEIKMIASVLVQLFNLQLSTGIRNIGATEYVSCCICLLAQCTEVADIITEMIDAYAMEQIIQTFSMIQDDELKRFIAPGISTIYTLKIKTTM